PGDTRLVVVVADDGVAAAVCAAAATAGAVAAVLLAPTGWADGDLADLWVLAADERVLVVIAPDPAAVARTAGLVSGHLRATKLVLTDPGGGWGDPPRSFVNLRRHRAQFAAELARRGDESLLPAAEHALRHGAASVNLCRAGEIETELFTFDGAGSVLTLGQYLELSELRVDDLPAVERLVAQGVRAGILKPRTRSQVARMAVHGLGARVARTGHLAGVVGLETDAYGREGLGEISGLVTVSEFSGAGAGEMLVEGLVERAAALGLGAVFAVTVSDAAGRFFLRLGFREVPRQDVPSAKWVGYDPERLARARCFRRGV
ncbi:MAG: GNAT family N-acetyltransferase, partial [Cellulomonadaceae bacterium]